MDHDTRAIASLNRAKRICIKGSFPTPAKISTRRVVQGGLEIDVMEAWAGKLAEWARNFGSMMFKRMNIVESSAVCCNRGVLEITGMRL